MLGQLDTKRGVVIADMEAGLGTLTRMGPGSVDLVVIVANPTEKSIEVARRARDVIAVRALSATWIVIANRIRRETDLEQVRTMLDDSSVVPVPEDPAIMAADYEGLSPVDSAPHSPAVEAVSSLTLSWTL